MEPSATSRSARPEPGRNRGQVWWARADKRRPVLLLSRPEAYAVRRKVIAAEVTTMMRINPATVELGRRDGMSERCVANMDNLVTVNQGDLLSYVTTLSRRRMAEVDEALMFALGLD